MRRNLVIVLAVLVALAVAGAAAAILSSSGVKEVSATFAAGVERFESRTCTGTDGKAYEVVHASYKGEATGSDDAFKGPILLQLTAVTNTSDGVGYVHGKLRIQPDNSDRHGWGSFWATRKGNEIDGFVVGGVNHRYARLLGNLKADFTPQGGFANGKIGGGAVGNGAALLIGNLCNGDGQEPNKKRGSDEKANGKQLLCHKGKKTLRVGAPATTAHLAHGDRLGSC